MEDFARAVQNFKTELGRAALAEVEGAKRILRLPYNRQVELRGQDGMWLIGAVAFWLVCLVWVVIDLARF